MSKQTSAIQQEIHQSKPFSSKAQEAGIALVRTVNLMQRRFAEVLDPYGVTGQQYNVLRILRGADEAVPTMEIAERMIEQTPGVTRLLDRLEEKGLVSRERCATDRRQVHCTISKAGLDLLKRLDEPVAQLDSRLLTGLSNAQLDALIATLDAIREHNK